MTQILLATVYTKKTGRKCTKILTEPIYFRRGESMGDFKFLHHLNFQMSPTSKLYSQKITSVTKKINCATPK